MGNANIPLLHSKDHPFDANLLEGEIPLSSKYCGKEWNSMSLTRTNVIILASPVVKKFIKSLSKKKKKRERKERENPLNSIGIERECFRNNNKALWFQQHEKRNQLFNMPFLGFSAWYNRQPRYIKMLTIAGPILGFIFLFILTICCGMWCKRRAPARLQVNLPTHKPQILSTQSKVPMQQLVNEA